MKKVIKFKGLSFLVLFSLLMLSCNNDDDDTPMPEPKPNIVQLAQSVDDLSSLVAALGQADAGLVQVLSSTGPFTVFAPTNQAFADLLNQLGPNYNSLADFDTPEEKALLAKILTYHVAAGKVLSTDLSDGMMVTTLQGEQVTVHLNGGVALDDATDTDATVTTADAMASNGVVHIINKVLLPQEVVDALGLGTPNIVELAQSIPDLSSLVAALIQADAGLVDVLSGDGPFTVFAPTNQAFIDLLNLLGPDYNSLADFDTADEKALLAKILTYHVVSGAAALSTDLTDGMTVTTVQGEDLKINLTSGVKIDDATDIDANVTTADAMASNGVVHIIDKVMLPQEAIDALGLNRPNIVELAQSVPDLSSLVAALIQADAGLVGVLSGDGPFTVFAPTNQAFADLLNQLGPSYNSLADFDTAAEKALLAKILTYHVVSGAAALSTDLTNGMIVTTVQGEDLKVNLTGGVKIDDATDIDANVTTADAMASNGVVHIIDKVMLPQEALDALSN